MELNRFGRWLGTAGVAACMAFTIAACGGGSSNSSATKTAANANGGPAALNGNGSGDGSGSNATASGICSKIARADVQALLPEPISAVTGDGIYDCIYRQPDGSALQVDIYNNDPDQKYYKTLSGNNDHQISGIGDQAYWNEAVSGQTPPNLIARKGNVTCVIGSNEPPDTTMKIALNSNTGLFTVTDADALAYVQLMGKVCNEAFAAQ